MPITVSSPIDGREVGTVPALDAAQVADVGARLRAAQPAWEALGPDGRGVWLGRFRDWLFDNEPQIVELIQAESGKVRGDAAIETTYGALVLNYYASNAKAFLAEEHPRPAHPSQLTKRLAVAYRPHPLVGVISPWNWPLVMPMLDIPAALMAGCAVLSKPSEVAPLTWHFCVEGWRAIGAPDVLACVTGAGATGEAVIDTVDMVQFTGSVATGRKVAARAGERLIPCSLELGGKDPMIVLADADLDRAVAGAVWGSNVNGGQGCIAVERVYVEAPVYDEFVERVVAQVRTLRQGTDTDVPFTAEVGAISSETQMEIIDRHVKDAVNRGARVLVGGNRRPGPGLYFEPTVLVDVDHTMAVMREETFGPITPIMSVADVDEAVALANDSSFGLSGSVWTGDRARGDAIARRMEAGGVCVNNVCVTNFQLPMPSGGWKTSGIGARFGGAAGIRKYCRAQAITTERIATKAEVHWYPFSPRKNGFMGAMSKLVEARDWRRRLGRPSR